MKTKSEVFRERYTNDVLPHLLDDQNITADICSNIENFILEIINEMQFNEQLAKQIPNLDLFLT